MSSKRGARFNGVVARFSANLADLASQLAASQVHFIRCLKPNAQLLPRTFHRDKVAAQLRCNGVLQACLIMKAGFPDRVTYGEALALYRSSLFSSREALWRGGGMLAAKHSASATAATRQAVEALLRALELETDGDGGHGAGTWRTRGGHVAVT